jgi:hypothetical protein
MRIISRRVFVVLVAVCVMSVVGVAGASAALPELVNKEGKALVKDKFSAKMTGGKAVEFYTDWAGEVKFYCETAAVAGDFSGLKTGEATFTLKTCKSNGGVGGKCTGVEKGKKREVVGEMVIPFSLTLVYTKKASKELALLFSLKETSSFVCAGSEFKLHGGFLVPIPQGDVNYLFEVGKGPFLDARYTASGEGEQEVKQYENEKGEKVETYLKLSTAEGTEVKSPVSFETEAAFEEEMEFKG